MNLRAVYTTGVILSLVFSLAPAFAFAQSSQDAKAYQDRLQADYDQAKKELEALTVQSNEIKNQKASLQRDIALIDAEIKQAQAKIKVKNLAIAQLTKDIGVKQNTITNLEAKLERSAESLADLLRRTNESDSVSMMAVFLGKAKRPTLRSEKTSKITQRKKF
jgi:septal ring factor EnvC (AmiA/AmiB activator)